MASKQLTPCVRWSQDEIDFLTANRGVMPLAEIAKELGRTESSVKMVCYRIGISDKRPGDPNYKRPKRQAVLTETVYVEVYALVPRNSESVDSSMRVLPAELVVWVVDMGEHDQRRVMSVIELEDYGRCCVPRSSLNVSPKKS